MWNDATAGYGSIKDYVTNKCAEILDLGHAPAGKNPCKVNGTRVGHLQGSQIRLVLGCVISPLRQHAESRNLGQTLFGSPVK